MPIAVLLVALVVGAEPAPAPPSAPAPAEWKTPWFLPRYAAVGAYAGLGVFSPTVRIGFEWAVISQKTEFVIVLEAGPSWGVIRPSDVYETYQHSALLGFGLRPSRDTGKFHWGLSAMAGPIVYGARFVDAAKNEERVNGMVEGRLQGGVRLGSIALALYVGYGQAFSQNARFAGLQFVGGGTFGLLVNWR